MCKRQFTEAPLQAGRSDELLERFRRWCEKQRAAELSEFVASLSDALSPPLLLELAKFDIDRRWRTARGLTLDAYLRKWPVLGELPAEYAELLRIEYVARSTYHAAPSDSEWAARFSKFADEPTRHEWEAQARAACDRESYEGAGRFFLVRRVGIGGMGEVFAALDRDRQCLVALKTLPTVDPERLLKFKHAFRALAEVVHPNLVSLYELVSHGEKWFFTMELIEGIDVLSWLRGSGIAAEATTRTFDATSGDPPPDSALAVDAPLAQRLDVSVLHGVLRQVVDGLSALHSARVLHRDVKPSNILVRADGRVVILDFGLIAEFGEPPLASDASRPAESMSGESVPSPYATDWSVVGTAAYMSPEQAAGKPLTPAADWYAIGVILYELLTGRRPFAGPRRRLLSEKQLLDAPPLSRSGCDAPPHLCALCDRLLERDPTRRADGTEILARLGDVATLAPPPLAYAARDAPFVGRLGPLCELQTALRQMQDGATVVVDISGPSGVGKTRLVRQFLCSAAHDPQIVVLEGRCYERESVPYKALDLLVDGLSRFLASLPPQEAEALMPHDVGALPRLFPVLSRVEAVAQAPGRLLNNVDGQDMRRQATRALHELLMRIGDRRPVVMWIDDLHWDDADSAAILSAIVQPQSAARLLLLLSYRSEHAERIASLAAIEEAIEQRSPRSPVFLRQSIRLGPLQPAESEELVGHLLPAHPNAGRTLARMVAQQSQGAPYFLQELARFVAAHADYAVPFGALQNLELNEVLRIRIERLPGDQRRLLEAVAVAGRPLRLSAACQAAEVDPGDRQPLRDLCFAHLLRTAGPLVRDEVDVFHDRLRISVISLLDPEGLRVRHGRLAEALRADQDDPETIAVHFHRAGRVEQAIEHYVIAADRAAVALAFERAARLYQASLALISADDAGRPTLERKVADALANAGRACEAAEAYLRATSGALPAELLDLRRNAAYHFCASGHIARGRREFEGLLARMGMHLPKSPRRAIASCLWNRLRIRCRGLGYRPRNEDELPGRTLAEVDVSWSVSVGLTMIDTIHAADYQSRNLLLALRAGEPYRLARAMAWQACHMATAGVPAQRFVRKLLDEADAIASQIVNPHATGLLTVARGITAFFQGRWDEGLRRCDEGEAILKEQCTGVVWERATARSFALWCLCFLGKTAELMVRQPELLLEARQRGDLLAEASLTNLSGSLMWLAQDRPHEAREHLNEAMHPWQGLGFRTQHFTSLASHTQIDLYTGAHESACRRMEQEWPRLTRSMLMHIEAIRIFMLHQRASCALAAVRARPADRRSARLARRCANRLARERASWGAAIGGLINAALADLRGDRDQALRLIGIAASQLEGSGLGLYAAAARHRQGELLGGTAGRALVAGAEQWMAEQRISRCAPMVELYAPGFQSK